MASRKYYVAALVSIITLLVFCSLTFAKTKHCSGTSKPYGVLYESKLVVGDIPKHEVKLFSSTSTSKSTCEEYDGVKTVTQLFSDGVGCNGEIRGYYTIYMKNGDKEFASFSATSSCKKKKYGKLDLTVRGKAKAIGGTGASVNKKWKLTSLGKMTPQGFIIEWEADIED